MGHETPAVTNIKASRPGEMTHVVLKGPMTVPSYQEQNLYALVFVDNFTRLITLRIFRDNWNAYEQLLSYISTVNGIKITKVETIIWESTLDSAFKVNLSKRIGGAELVVLDPKDVAGKGTATAQCHNLIMASNAMLKTANLSNSFWDYAMNYAVCLANRTTNSLTGLIPGCQWARLLFKSDITVKPASHHSFGSNIVTSKGRLAINYPVFLGYSLGSGYGENIIVGIGKGHKWIFSTINSSKCSVKTNAFSHAQYFKGDYSPIFPEQIKPPATPNPSPPKGIVENCLDKGIKLSTYLLALPWRIQLALMTLVFICITSPSLNTILLVCIVILFLLGNR